MLIFPLNNDVSRKILHIDMDAFFASVEMRDNPDLKHKAVVIARHPKETGGRGVVSTANYKAREYGIHSAMSASEAYELCPNAVFIAGDYQKYRHVSQQVRQIFQRYTDIIEPLSIDEAYLDVTKNKIDSNSAIKIAKMIQHDIWNEVHLTCSAGVSYNKFLAKLGSDYEKPRGLTVITPETAQAFLCQLPIEKFYGIGKKSVEHFHRLGIYRGEELLKVSEMDLINDFGKMGYSLYRKVRGVHNAPVEVVRVRKSIGKENTYGTPLVTEEQVNSELQKFSDKISNILSEKRQYGQTVVIKVRTKSFATKTKRISTDLKIFQARDILYFAESLFQEVGGLDEGIRLLGVTVTGLFSLEIEQLELDLW
ncbi:MULTISPECIES: DNA polymerase IV [unclassified Enterococcus]|uniref:DNA polymerase IV n=1 Tax=unclassified Enterococcus TaxID=2608891 RepID=UPI00155628FB|nr:MULTISPECIES: DNA polymerase IV [unclassified Enterococcus]MBS7577530.1 DNA polymerase IV [Enterococcus sp. MMGLQ5-2]MBS7584971.1 DNA polymerase IV [Enterococcus sp. MMGLQ5-1]NPD12826.1 DNA polymerase IV [Enterococcus sp. MMGLQ5-1]NPD37363.1 DNA polymerase IV [Enterococcus sp. MMGLQ5-2]